MSDLTYDAISSALKVQPLFENKTWQLSPSAWPLTREQLTQLEEIGNACLEFHQALETLYTRSANGKNLLRNKPLLTPWVAEYLDRGKPAPLIQHARNPKNRGVCPLVLRPDLLVTEEGFVMSELDSVPGGIGLTAFLNRLYSPTETGGNSGDTPKILGADDAMIRNFYNALCTLRPDMRNPLIALVVSDEASTYRPEMHWLAEQLQRQGKRVYCLDPEDIFPLGNTLCFDIEGNPEKIDIIYRFFELFDLANIRTANFIFEAWQAGEVAITPPMRHFQEEKLALALFHHHLLADFWNETLSPRSRKLLKQLIPATWIIDPAPLPPGAVLDGPQVGGHAMTDWRQLAAASQKERDLIIKISGYHETAWGARSVVLGSDCSREEWQAGIDTAIADAPHNLHILQEYKKPKRLRHRLYAPESQEAAENSTQQSPAIREADGRLRLCPYYFVQPGPDGKLRAQLSGALATFCPPDKKIIHGMQDAALLPAVCV